MLWVQENCLLRPKQPWTPLPSPLPAAEDKKSKASLMRNFMNWACEPEASWTCPPLSPSAIWPVVFRDAEEGAQEVNPWAQATTW